MQHALADAHLLLRVPECHVGVRADRDRALARIEPVQLRGIGRGQRHEAVQVDAAAADPLGEQQRQPQLYSRHAVGDHLERRIGAVMLLAVAALVAIGRVVGGDHLEDAGGEPVPHRLLARAVARRRAAHALRPLEAGLVEVGGGQEQVLRAGLGVDPEALALRPADLLDRVAVGDVHDQDRHVDQLGERDGAVRRLALGDAGMGDGMVFRLRVPGRQQPVGQPLDHVVVLGMDHDEGAFRAGERQHLEHLAIIQAQAVIGHVDLERGVAVLDQRRQLLAQDFRGRVGDDHVESVVDDRLRRGQRMIVLDHPAERHAAVLRGEGNDGGGAAAGGRARAGIEVVRRLHA